MPPDEALQQQQEKEQLQLLLLLHSSRDNLNEIYVETTYAEFTTTTEATRAQTSRGLVGVLASCGKQ